MLKLLHQTPKVLISRSTRLSKLFGSSRQRQSQILFTLFARDLSAVNSHSMANNTPKMIVFDLDYTLWPFWVDTHVSPPFKMDPSGKVFDARKNRVEFYPKVPEILARLHSEGYKLGIASRTGATEDAESLVSLFDWDQYFHYRQIYPDCKITHFKELQRQSGIAFKDMLFFDDENRNIKDVSSLGVTCMFVPDHGVNNESLREGLELFKTNSSKS